MLHEFKTPDVYEVRNMARRAGLKTATVKVAHEGRKGMAAYLISDMPETYDNKLVREYKINLTKRVVEIIIAA